MRVSEGYLRTASGAPAGESDQDQDPLVVDLEDPVDLHMQRPIPNLRIPGAKQLRDAALAAYYFGDPWHHAGDSKFDLRMDVGEYRLEVPAVPVLIALANQPFPLRIHRHALSRSRHHRKSLRSTGPGTGLHLPAAPVGMDQAAAGRRPRNSTTEASAPAARSLGGRRRLVLC